MFTFTFPSAITVSTSAAAPVALFLHFGVERASYANTGSWTQHLIAWSRRVLLLSRLFCLNAGDLILCAAVATGGGLPGFGLSHGCHYTTIAASSFVSCTSPGQICTYPH